MIKLRNIKGAVSDIKKTDPDTAMTVPFLTSLIESGMVGAEYNNGKYLLDMELLRSELTEAFLVECDSVPTLRTIREAVNIIRHQDTNTSITEYKIRQWIKNGRLHCRTVGTRQIIAMEFFDRNDFLEITRDTHEKKNYTHTSDLFCQYDKVLESTTQEYVCKRNRSRLSS